MTASFVSVCCVTEFNSLQFLVQSVSQHIKLSKYQTRKRPSFHQSSLAAAWLVDCIPELVLSNGSWYKNWPGALLLRPRLVLPGPALSVSLVFCIYFPWVGQHFTRLNPLLQHSTLSEGCKIHFFLFRNWILKSVLQFDHRWSRIGYPWNERLQCWTWQFALPYCHTVIVFCSAETKCRSVWDFLYCNKSNVVHATTPPRHRHATITLLLFNGVFGLICKH